MPGCPSVFPSLRPSNPGKRNLCVLSRIPFKMGNCTRGVLFFLPGHPRGLGGAGLQVTTREAAFCNPDPLQREFHNTFSCCLGQPRRSQTLSPGWRSQTLSPGLSSRLLCVEGRADPATSREVFSNVFGSIGAFWPKIVCPGFVLSLSPSDCCLWKFWKRGGCYLLFDIFPFCLLLFCLLFYW